MSALDELDLSLKLSKEEEAEQLAAAQERLLTLRLQLGGQTADELGPPLCVLFEGWDASGKGGAIKRLVDHLDPRHVRVVQYAAPTPDEKRHQYLLRFADGAAGLGRDGRARPLLVRARARRARRGLRDEGRVEARLPRDQRLRARAVRRRDDPRQVLDARLRRRAAQALQGAREGPAEVLEADRRGLAQPRASAAQYEAAIDEMVERTSTDYAPWYADPGASRSATPGWRCCDTRDRGDRGSASPSGGGPCAPASGRASSRASSSWPPAVCGLRAAMPSGTDGPAVTISGALRRASRAISTPMTREADDQRAADDEERRCGRSRRCPSS